MKIINKVLTGFIILSLITACSLKGLPPNLEPPTPSKPIRAVQVQGFFSNDGTMQRSMASIDTSGNVAMSQQKIPFVEELFLNELSDLDLAEYYLNSGKGDFQIIGEKTHFRGGIKQRRSWMPIVCYFTLMLGCVPWLDYAEGELTVKVYDGKGNYLGKVDETAKGSYWNWLPSLLSNKDFKMRDQLRSHLVKRVANQTVKLIRENKDIK